MTWSHLQWEGAATLPPAARQALLGPGAPFELVTEPVLGHDHVVFARRPHAMREMLQAAAELAPEQALLISPERQWSYAQALADIDAAAMLLSARYGIGRGDRVAIVAANYAEYAIVMWATLTLGALVTSLNGWWTTPELCYGVALTTPSLITGDARRLARLSGPGADVPAGVPVLELTDLLEQASEFAGKAPPPAGITEDSPAVILFSSGTTGRPKGVTLSHRNLINFAMVQRLAGAMAAATGPAGPPRPARLCTIVSSPMFHVSGMIGALITPTLAPTALVFPPPGPWTPQTWLELTQRHRVTQWSGVPTQLWRLLRYPGLDDYDISSVLTVGTGGAVFPPELVRELSRRLPGLRVGQGFGMSETVGLGALTGGELFTKVPSSVGPAQATVEIEIRDELGAVAPEGSVGEICLRTPSLFLGYWNDPAATAACLDDARWYRTGDYGRVSGGLLYLESRRRDLIVRGGENIYPIEIENRLVEHPGIDDAAVIGVDHADLGQQPKAFVVPAAGAELTEQEVRSWCAAALAAFKVPAAVEFRSSLPYNAAGKLVKAQLEAEEQARAAVR